MSTKVVTETTELKSSPIEEFFNLDANSTEVVKYEQKTELVKVEEYDKKDNEIEEDFQEVYDKAISGYETLQEQIEDIDPKYISRTQEVANQLLSTALNAATQKAKLKEHKDKIVNKANKGPKSVTNVLVTDTNSLIKKLRELNNQQNDDQIIDITPESSTDEKE